MTRRFDQTWNLMLMAITLSALATPRDGRKRFRKKSKLKIVPQRR